MLNVWQYDEQVFTFEGGRLLLRGANGAGKSKTLEMLLPFVLDGDKARMTASARHHTSLLWLMQEGSSGTGTRTGYLWVEFRRHRGRDPHLRCRHPALGEREDRLHLVLHLPGAGAARRGRRHAVVSAALPRGRERRRRAGLRVAAGLQGARRSAAVRPGPAALRRPAAAALLAAPAAGRRGHRARQARPDPRGVAARARRRRRARGRRVARRARRARRAGGAPRARRRRGHGVGRGVRPVRRDRAGSPRRRAAGGRPRARHAGP